MQLVWLQEARLRLLQAVVEECDRTEFVYRFFLDEVSKVFSVIKVEACR